MKRVLSKLNLKRLEEIDMGKLVRQCDMEVMKMAMLKHEETFRQQVYIQQFIFFLPSFLPSSPPLI